MEIKNVIDLKIWLEQDLGSINRQDVVDKIYEMITNKLNIMGLEYHQHNNKLYMELIKFILRNTYT